MQTTAERGVYEPAFKLPWLWEGSGMKLPRSEPDSGNPTVRDRREASGNVAMGAGLRSGAKAPEQPPDPKVRAPEFYPDDLSWGPILTSFPGPGRGFRCSKVELSPGLVGLHDWRRCARGVPLWGAREPAGQEGSFLDGADSPFVPPFGREFKKAWRGLSIRWQ